MAPRLLFLILGSSFLAGCSTEPVDLIVELETDRRPGLDFSSVVVTLDDGDMRERAVRAGDDFSSAARVAEFRGLVPEFRTVTVELLDDSGAVVAERASSIDHRTNRGIRVIVVGDDVGVDGGMPPPPITGGECLGLFETPIEDLWGGQVVSDEMVVAYGRFDRRITVGDVDYFTDGGFAPIVVAHDPADGSVYWSLVFEDGEGAAITNMVADGDDIYIGGYFHGELRADGLDLSSAGFGDGFVVRLDTEGRVIAAVSLGGGGLDTVDTLTIDASGALLVAGSFGSGADLLGTTYTADGGNDGFILRLDRGNLSRIAVLTVSGSHWEGVDAIAEDAGELYIGGTFDGELELFTLHHSADDDAFAARTSFDGDYLWSGELGVLAFDFVNDIALSNELAIYVGVMGRISSNGRGYVRAYGRQGGDVAWEVQVGDQELENQSQAVVVDERGIVYVGSSFSEEIDVGTRRFESLGGKDALITAHDPTDGSVLWSRTFQSGSHDTAADLVLDDDFLWVFFDSEHGFDCEGPGYATLGAGAYVARLSR